MAELANAYTADANQPAIEAIIKLYPAEDYLTMSQFLDGLHTATVAGEFEEFGRASKAEPSQPIDPRTESQRRWAGFTEWSENASSREIQERARTDRQFAAFRRGQYLAEMNVPIDGDVRLTNPQEEMSVRVTEELRAFADEVNRMPSSEVKMQLKVGVNPSAAQFRKQLDAAMAAGLVR